MTPWEALLENAPRLAEKLKAMRPPKLRVLVDGRDLLVLRPDRKPPIAVLPLERLLALLRRVGGGA